MSEDGDTLFFFNYRSDRMREITSVFGLPDKPMEVKVPKDIVSWGLYTVFQESLQSIGSTSQQCQGTT